MKKSNLVYIIFIFLSFKILAQPSNVLSYEIYLKNVLEHNPISKKAENIKQYGELQYKAAKGNFDPSISGPYDNKYFNNSYHEIVLRRRMKRVKISTDRHGLLL